MTSRTRVSVVLTAAAAAVFAAAPAAAVPPVPATPGQNCAAGFMADPNSGNCWQMADSGTPSVGGGPCLPGRVGTCIGYLANNPYAPGDTLPDSSSWP